MSSRNAINYKMVESIMKNKYFNGLSQMTKRETEKLLDHMLSESNLLYFEIIVKYLFKNIEFIKKGFRYSAFGGQLLINLLEGKECNQEFINMFFKCCNLLIDDNKKNSENQSDDMRTLKNIFDNAIRRCERGGRRNKFDPQWKMIIQQYGKQTEIL